MVNFHQVDHPSRIKVESFRERTSGRNRKRENQGRRMGIVFASLLFVVLLLICIHGSEAEETRAGVGKPNASESRIINGQQAVDGRYPYVVSLVLGSKHICAGTWVRGVVVVAFFLHMSNLLCYACMPTGSLISPDMVLTAGHCGGFGRSSVEIGRHNREDYLDQFEQILVEQELLHPSYVDGLSLRFDQLLLKLSSSSLVTPVKVNLNSNLPGSNQDVTVMGWGLTESGNDNSLSPILLEARLQTLSNSECEQVVDYRGFIFDDMLCAYETGKDSCQGDSGGPLIMETSNGDLQVGIVSWGEGCAEEFVPGVYSRLSYDADWLVRTVCRNSDFPPTAFNCSAVGDEPSASPTRTPGVFSANIRIQLDAHPGDIGWRLDHIGSSLKTVAQRTPGAYNTPNELVQETIALQEGEIYSFFIFDTFKDGICCGSGDGNYRLEVGDRVVFEGNGRFGNGNNHTFIASEEETPSTAPITPGNLFLELQIRFDRYPAEVGWILRAHEEDNSAGCVSGQIIAFKAAGSYSIGLRLQLITEVISLPSAGNYTFHVLDSSADGLCCLYGRGYYRLYEGSVEQNKILAEGNAAGSSRDTTSFSISETETVPKEPTISPAPTSLQSSVDIIIWPGENPGDIGWRIEDENRRTAVSRSAGYYTGTSTIAETVSLEANAFYTFFITGKSEDGICCDSGNGLFRVETSNGIVGYGGTFEASDSIVLTTLGNFPVALKVQTDQYPKQIRWRLERLDLEDTATVSTVPTGFHDTPLELIERNFMVTEGGFYRFTIEDSKSDGICCRNGQGSIELKVGEDQRVVASELGDYAIRAAFHFLGSSSNSLPTVSNPRILTLSFKFDRFPDEVSWLLLQDEDNSAVSVSRFIRRNNVQIAAFGPRDSAYYSSELALKTYTETIEIEQVPEGNIRGFTFIIFDSAGDGLCCEWGSGEYTLYDGASASSAKVLLTSNAAGKARASRTFALSRDGTAPPPSPTPGGSSGAISLNALCPALAATLTLAATVLL